MESESSILVLLLLVILSGFFSGSETALVSLSPAKVRTLVEKKKKFSLIIASLKEKPDRLLITILIGNNIVNIAASVMATSVAQDAFGSSVLAYVVGVMTLIILIFGEIVPKTLAQRFHVGFAQASSPILFVLGYALYPVIWLLEKLTNTFIWMLGREKFKSVTEEELIAMLNIGHEEGEFNQQENEFIQNIFEFSDTTAEEVMINRNEIEAFSGDITLEKALKKISKSSHSRMPVYDKSIDNIVGYITLKDLLKFSRLKSNLKKKISELKLHKILFFPVTKPINNIFRTFQKKRVHIAIILDEFGSTAGLVTIEDVLEEIVGDIVDESDVEEKSIKKTGKNTFHLEANTTVEELYEFHDFDAGVPEHKTIAFLIIKQLGAFPREGEKVYMPEEGVEFVVEKMAGKTIQKVRMQIKKKKVVKKGK
jgi:putative hemolysin